LRIIYSYIMDVLVLMSLALVFNKVIETIIMLFTFAVLQVYGGGYHAKTQLGCMAIMVAGWFVGVFGLEKLVTLHWCVGIVVMVVFTVVVFRFAPVLNQKHPVSSDVYIMSKKIVRTTLIVLDVALIASIIMHIDWIYSSIGITQVLSTASIFAAVIKNHIISGQEKLRT